MNITPCSLLETCFDKVMNQTTTIACNESTNKYFVTGPGQIFSIAYPIILLMNASLYLYISNKMNSKDKIFETSENTSLLPLNKNDKEWQNPYKTPEFFHRICSGFYLSFLAVPSFVGLIPTIVGNDYCSSITNEAKNMMQIASKFTSEVCQTSLLPGGNETYYYNRKMDLYLDYNTKIYRDNMSEPIITNGTFKIIVAAISLLGLCIMYSYDWKVNSGKKEFHRYTLTSILVAICSLSILGMGIYQDYLGSHLSCREDILNGWAGCKTLHPG